ncbi:hypothetical protein Btru_065376 [Bulinus truncatus]|nr:hypothetical protein Btru_065376 [Bulinus truncatus]
MKVPQLVLLAVVCVFIIVGNCFVLAAIRLSENGRKSRMNFFIMHLAIADLLVGVMVVITDMANKITVEWYAGNAMCKIIQYSQTTVTYCSTYMLVSLSIDRYDAVARPMNFSRSGLQGRFLVLVSWLVSLVFASPSFYLFSETVREGKRQCWLELPEAWHWQDADDRLPNKTCLAVAIEDWLRATDKLKDGGRVNSNKPIAKKKHSIRTSLGYAVNLFRFRVNVTSSLTARAASANTYTSSSISLRPKPLHLLHKVDAANVTDERGRRGDVQNCKHGIDQLDQCTTLVRSGFGPIRGKKTTVGQADLTQLVLN